MPSSTLHNPQQKKQPAVKEEGMGQGTGKVMNSLLGKGGGKVMNSFGQTTKGSGKHVMTDSGKS